ncbi:Uncharacterized protein FWK35_00000501, partial [Aphis craccivora]
MMCFWSSKKASIFKLSPVSVRKVNLVGTLGGQSKKFPMVFKKIEKNKKKNDGKTEIFTQNQFSTKSIILNDFIRLETYILNEVMNSEN